MSNLGLVEIVEHTALSDSAELMAEEAAAWLGLLGKASVAIAGDFWALPFVDALASYSIPWGDIALTSIEERVVPNTHPASHIGSIERQFSLHASPPQFVSLNEPMAAMCVSLPFDLIVLAINAEDVCAPLFMQGGAPPGEAPIVATEVPGKFTSGRDQLLRWNSRMLMSARRTMILYAGSSTRHPANFFVSGPVDTPLRSIVRSAKGPVTIHSADIPSSLVPL